MSMCQDLVFLYSAFLAYPRLEHIELSPRTAATEVYGHEAGYVSSVVEGDGPAKGDGRWTHWLLLRGGAVYSVRVVQLGSRRIGAWWWKAYVWTEGGKLAGI